MDPMPPATGNLCELVCSTCRTLAVHRRDDAGRWWCEQCRLRRELATVQPAAPAYQPPPAYYGYGHPPPQYMPPMPAPPAPPPPKRQGAFSTGLGMGCGCFSAIALTIILMLVGVGMCGNAAKAAPTTQAK